MCSSEVGGHFPPSWAESFYGQSRRGILPPLLDLLYHSTVRVRTTTVSFVFFFKKKKP